MFHALYRVILKENAVNAFRECWQIIATHMTQHRGAISSEFYYDDTHNYCFIHSKWVSKAFKEANWPLPKDKAPQEILEAEARMSELRVSVKTDLTLSDLDFQEQQLTIKSENALFNKQGKITSKKNHILIFNDDGCGSNGVQATFNSLMASIDTSFCKILIVDAAYLRKTNWEEKTRLLIISGGRARPYYTALGATWQQEEVETGQFRILKSLGDGNERIKKFVEAGGNFMGICAGAYYAASETIFERSGKLEVLDKGALNFFPGSAEGPAYGLNKFEYKSEAGAEVAQISSDKFAIKSLPVYFNGGCYFHMGDQLIPDTMVLARYQNVSPASNSNTISQPAAIVESSIGLGKAILSGVHIEYLSHASKLTPAIKEGLIDTDQDRLLVFARMIRQLNTPLADDIEKYLLPTDQVRVTTSLVNQSKLYHTLTPKKVIATDTTQPLTNIVNNDSNSNIQLTK